MQQTTPAVKGFITGALMIIASLFSFYILKNPIESYFQYVVYLIFSLGIIWSLIQYSKADTIKKVFKDYFSVGFKTFVVIVLLMAIFTFIFFTYNTTFRDEKIAENSRLLALKGDHFADDIKNNEQQLRKMFMPLMISSAVFRFLIIGSIVTAILSGFLSQKEKAIDNNPK